jgi:hypothetical protein
VNYKDVKKIKYCWEQQLSLVFICDVNYAVRRTSVVSPQGTDFITQNQGDLTAYSMELACMRSIAKTANIRSSLTMCTNTRL